MTFLRRLASVLLALCFVLPLSQCDLMFSEDGKPLEVARRVEHTGYELMSQNLRNLTAGNYVDGVLGAAHVALVFFLPLATWKLRPSRQAMVHVAASPLIAYTLVLWLYVFASRALFGGILASLCWAILFLCGCVILVQRVRIVLSSRYKQARA